MVAHFLAIMDLDSWTKPASLIFAMFTWYATQRRRPQLEAFYTHVGTHQIPAGEAGAALVPAAGPVAPGVAAAAAAAGAAAPTLVNTHVLLIRNSGRAPARNVRITHAVLSASTDIQYFPMVNVQRRPLAPQGGELAIDSLPPRFQLTISYLYLPTVTFLQMGIIVTSDDGMAQLIASQHVRVVPTWLRWILYVLLFSGVLLVTYLVLRVAVFLFVLI